MRAKKFICVLRPHWKDLVSWTPEGDVSIRGEFLQRVHFTDLLSDVVRSRPLRNIPPSYEKILKALVTANVPETVINNKTALNHYRAMKRDNETFGNEVSSTAEYQDNNVSNVRNTLRSKDWEAPK